MSPEQQTVFHVFYMRPDFFADGILGAATPDLAETHIHLKDVVLPGGPDRLEDVFAIMQGEHWSPNGEARELIAAKGLRHTSMSTGDVVVVNGAPHMVVSFGFAAMPRSVLRNVPELVSP